MKKTVVLIGGGPSAFMVASFLDPKKFDVTIYEKNKAPGRKFLVAGQGGFNLTHSEPIDAMITRFTPDHFLKEALLGFTNEDLRDWLKELGIPTIVGSSKRVYPEKGIKPITVLNKIMERLEKQNVHFEYEHDWKGWTEIDELLFSNGKKIKTDYTVFSLGGGSYKVTGSDGSWLEFFSKKGIKTLPFLPSNCAYKIDWPEEFISKNEGKPLKNISLSCLGKIQMGELVITKFGLEGNAIYALSPEIRSELTAKGLSTIFLDLKPALSLEEVQDHLKISGSKTTDTLKRKLNLGQAQIQLLKSMLNKEEFLDPKILSGKIKYLPLTVLTAAPLDEAISSTGGIALEEVNENFEFHKLKNTFCIGEMLNWNAPTGGYLLQACFSMGVHVAKYLTKVTS